MRRLNESYARPLFSYTLPGDTEVDLLQGFVLRIDRVLIYYGVLLEPCARPCLLDVLVDWLYEHDILDEMEKDVSGDATDACTDV